MRFYEKNLNSVDAKYPKFKWIKKDKCLRNALKIESKCKKCPFNSLCLCVLRGGEKYVKLGFEFSECICKGRRGEIVYGEDSW
jgi:hypothetical protein